MTESDHAQVTESLSPTTLEIRNNSHLHAHHKAMQGSTSRETHFEYTFPSPADSFILPPYPH